MYIFHVENDRRFPFSLVLSISHLDHFRGISSRRSASISPLLVNEKVVDHFFEINDKKKRKERGKKRSGESISGLKTRSLVLSRNPFRYYQHQFFESVRSLTLLYRQEKKSWRIYLPSSISNTVSSISKLKGKKKKKMTHSSTIDFSPLLNFIFVGMLIKIFTSFPNLFVVSSCDFFIQLLIIIYLSI